MSFPKMRRFQQELPKNVCEQILNEQVRGVLALSGLEGYPYALPLNFAYEDGVIYFHGAKVGTKISLLEKNPKVSFCVYDQGQKRQDHWSLYIQSVIVFGTIQKVEDPQEVLKAVRALASKFPADPQEIEKEIAGAKERVQVLALHIDHMSGKRVNEK